MAILDTKDLRRALLHFKRPVLCLSRALAPFLRKRAVAFQKQQRSILTFLGSKPAYGEAASLSKDARSDPDRATPSRLYIGLPLPERGGDGVGSSVIFGVPQYRRRTSPPFHFRRRPVLRSPTAEFERHCIGISTTPLTILWQDSWKKWRT